MQAIMLYRANGGLGGNELNGLVPIWVRFQGWVDATNGCAA